MKIDDMPLDTITLLDATIPHDFHIRAAILIAALGLDALVGDPQWLWGRIPHPVVLFGRAIANLDRLFNRPRLAGIRLTGKARRRLGVLSILLLVGTAVAIGGGISILASVGGAMLSASVELLLVAVLLAGRSLADHVNAVATTLKEGNIDEARNAISRIVARNPKVLDRAAIARAAIETTAENLSDAVVAPVLFYLAFGLPGIFAYKMINTTDSMIGYRSARHLAFGWGAARLDDFVNLIPARLTGLLIAISEPMRTLFTLKVMLRDAPHHRSSNAGWPEAAMAAQLRLSLGGARLYGQRMSGDREMNQGDTRKATHTYIPRALAVMWRTTVTFSVLLGMLTLLRVIFST